MLNCEQASELLSRALDEQLPLSTRMSLRLHLLMCRCCSPLERNLTMLRRTLRKARPPEPGNGNLNKVEETVRRELRNDDHRKDGD